MAEIDKLLRNPDRSKHSAMVIWPSGFGWGCLMNKTWSTDGSLWVHHMVGGSLGSSELPDLLTADIPWFLVAMGAYSWEKTSLISPSIGHTVQGLAHHGGGAKRVWTPEGGSLWAFSERGTPGRIHPFFSKGKWLWKELSRIMVPSLGDLFTIRGCFLSCTFFPMAWICMPLSRFICWNLIPNVVV